MQTIKIKRSKTIEDTEIEDTIGYEYNYKKYEHTEIEDTKIYIMIGSTKIQIYDDQR